MGAAAAAVAVAVDVAAVVKIAVARAVQPVQRHASVPQRLAAHIGCCRFPVYRSSSAKSDLIQFCCAAAAFTAYLRWCIGCSITHRSGPKDGTTICGLVVCCGWVNGSEGRFFGWFAYITRSCRYKNVKRF